MRRPVRRVSAGAGLALVLCAATAAAEEAGARLEVAVHGLASDKGGVGLALYDTRASYEDGAPPFRSGYVPIEGKRARWVVPALPEGTYAVKVFHDSNGNRELDVSALRIPTEAYGFSNDARGKFGPPAFDAARFKAGDRPTVIEIRVD